MDDCIVVTITAVRAEGANASDNAVAASASTAETFIMAKLSLKLKFILKAKV